MEIGPDTSSEAPEPGSPGWVEDRWDSSDLLPKTHATRLPRNRRWLRWVLFIVVIAFVAAVITGGAIGMWVARQVNPPGVRGDEVAFTVSDTDTLDSIIARMDTQGIVTSARVFKWYVERQGGLIVAPGYYTVHPRDTMGNIVKALRTPPSQTVLKVTFPEGFTLRQESRRLAEKVTRLKSSDFYSSSTDGSIKPTITGYPADLKSLEGLLFPSTYYVAGNESEADVINKMLKLTERVGRQEEIEAKSALLGLSPYQVMIVASIIEREANNDEDRAKIARVIYNRLFFNVPLEVDATLFYGVEPGTPFSALRNVDTPYNSYMHNGLPPTPISNPGRASIRAALNPALNPPSGDPICTSLPKTNPPTPCIYLFYVLKDKDGHHVFAATAEQHLANVEAARAAGLLGN